MMNQKDPIFKGTLIPILILVMIWVVHYFNLSYPDSYINQHGIKPRNWEGLQGIIFSPFLHSTEDYSHIFNNSIPLFVLCWLFILSYKNIFGKTIMFIWLFSGLCVWLAGRTGPHIGASGVIYGLAFFLFFSGVFSKEKRLIAVSLIVVFLYGSMVWGIFPSQEKISWEGHLFGAISGIIMAYYFKGRYLKTEKYKLDVNPEFENFVEQYNYELRIAEEERKKLSQENSSNTLDDNFKVFFDYLKKNEDN